MVGPVLKPHHRKTTATIPAGINSLFIFWWQPNQVDIAQNKVKITAKIGAAINSGNLDREITAKKV